MGETHDAPIMPHRLYGAAELDQRHPSIQAVEEEDEDEELEDQMVKHGEEIAKSIVEDAKTFGRRRVVREPQLIPDDWVRRGGRNVPHVGAYRTAQRKSLLW